MQNFKQKMIELCSILCSHKDDVLGNEQGTKEHLIGPFFSELGWRKDPKTWKAEFDADFSGRKKGERVDYAIIKNNEPVILIECKPYSPKEKQLTSKDGQLARYFAATNAQIAIITNGIVYRFFTDLEKANIQDSDPFFVFDCSNPSDSDLTALELFSAHKFDVKQIHDWASENQFSNRAKTFISKLVSRPDETDGFAHYVLEHIYDGQRSQKVVQRLNEQLQAIMSEVLSEEIRSRFSSVKKQTESEMNESGIVTTPEEIAAFNTIRALLVGIGHKSADIVYKDLRNWMNISYRKGGAWFCRLFFNDKPIGILFRQPLTEIQKYVTDGFVAVSKGKNTFVEISPEDTVKLSEVIKYSFESFIKSDETQSSEDEEEEQQEKACT